VQQGICCVVCAANPHSESGMEHLMGTVGSLARPLWAWHIVGALLGTGVVLALVSECRYRSSFQATRPKSLQIALLGLHLSDIFTDALVAHTMLLTVTALGWVSVAHLIGVVIVNCILALRFLWNLQREDWRTDGESSRKCTIGCVLLFSVFAPKLVTLLGTGVLGLKAFSLDMERYRHEVLRVSHCILFETTGQIAIQIALLYRWRSLLLEGQRPIVYASVVLSVLDLVCALIQCFDSDGADCTLGAYSRVSSQEESLRMGEYGGLGDWRTLKYESPVQELGMTAEPHREPVIATPSRDEKVEDEEAVSAKADEIAAHKASDIEAQKAAAKAALDAKALDDAKEAAKEDFVVESCKQEDVNEHQRKVQMRHRLANLKMNQGQNLTSKDWASIFSPGVHGFKCLRWLDLANNKLTDTSAISISDGLRSGGVSQLIMVGLAENMIGDEGAVAFVKALGYGHCPLIATLWLQKNGLGNRAAKELADGLGNGHCKAITLLGLSQNSIGTAGAVALGKGLGHGHCPMLKLLGLAENQITNDGAVALCHSLGDGQCPALTKLSLQGNNIDNKETLQLVERLGNGHARPMPRSPPQSPTPWRQSTRGAQRVQTPGVK